jgi:hypothetical protein
VWFGAHARTMAVAKVVARFEARMQMRSGALLIIVVE